MTYSSVSDSLHGTKSQQNQSTEAVVRKQPEKHTKFFEGFLYYIKKKNHKIKKGSVNIYLRSPSKSLSVQQPWRLISVSLLSLQLM